MPVFCAFFRTLQLSVAVIGPFDSASVRALLKRTATITQAGVGSQMLRSRTVAFNHCVASSKLPIYLHQ